MEIISPNMGAVTVGGMRYTIIEVPKVEGEGLTLGRIEHKEQVIKLDEAMRPDRMRFALAHEIVHGILMESGFNRETQDEKLVNAIARGFIEVIDQKIPILMNGVETVERFYMGRRMVENACEKVT